MKNWIRLSLLLVANATRAWAEVRLAGIFTDHMVLQRDRPIQAWGWADKGEAITVEFAEHAAKTTAGEDGAWSVTLKPLAASAEGRELRVQVARQRIAVRDVVVGEVWHASGQSNMAMTVGSMARELEPVKSDIAAADLPAIRFCRVNEAESSQPLDDLRVEARWTPCSPTTVAGFSGVAFYFARQLHTELDVPVGIHPPNKIDVGQRLALWALAKDYGKQIAFCGPTFERQEVQGNKVVVHFKHADSGLMVATKNGLSAPRKTANAELAHFELADNTGAWPPAQASIDGGAVVVTSDRVPQPVAVRYAYEVTPEGCNLYGRDGLPASPFCSKPEMLRYDPGLPR